MSWSSWHRQSERLAEVAEAEVRRGNIAEAQRLFEDAALHELHALESLTADKPRTLGITAVSAAALWYKAGKLQKAAHVAHHASTMVGMPPFALNELRALLQSIWNEEAQCEAGLSFLPGQVLVSVKGGQVVTGGAPLDLIVDKVQVIQNLFFRTAEYLKSMPLRKRGPPPRELQERCRPWLFQSAPGSYQFAVAIQKPRQEELFPIDVPEPDALTDTFLSILRGAVGENPDAPLETLIAKQDYRVTFLKLTRNLAPTGKSFDQLEVRGSGDREPIVLSPASRRLISDSLRHDRDANDLSHGQEVTLQGVLRALDLEHDWLEIVIDGVKHRVSGVGETVDDLIGPMVNRETIVRAKLKNQRYTFVDIELVE